jgi:uncharacterized repeat protein (TIGR03803 family)
MKLSIGKPVLVLFATIFAIAMNAHSQTFQIIHTFTGGGDGGNPPVGVSIDTAGNLYGVTAADTNGNTGVAYELKRHGNDWLFFRLHAFMGFQDGVTPTSRPLRGSDGTIYGTTGGGPGYGCLGGGCGVVYHLQPSPSIPASFESPWIETFPYEFQGPPSDGATPQGDLMFDQQGNIYGTTENGPQVNYCCGLVYELSRSGTGWIENFVYAFQGGNDGAVPRDGVVADSFGNLYGVVGAGQYNSGAVYELSPSNGGWTEKIIHAFNFSDDGANPIGGLIIDANGNLYGSTTIGPDAQCNGIVFELSPPPPGGQWNYQRLYCFSGPPEGSGPYAKLAMDSVGNLYGTTFSDGSGSGTIFKLSPTGNAWIYTLLHEFTGGADGGNPDSTVTFDGEGNLYGTTLYSGSRSCNCGVVWEVTP